MLSPIKTVFMYYPLRSFVTILLMIFVSIIALNVINKEYKRGKISKQKGVVLWIFINYSIILLFFTVLGRRSLDYYRYNFDFGYSYQEVFVLGNSALASQIFVNIVMFIPIGIMGGIIARKFTVIRTVIYGFSLSFIIEVLQLILRRGYCELDDLISNFLGTMVGCLLIIIHDRMRIWRKI